MDSTLNPTPNQLDSLETRLQKARDFLQENPNEQPIIAARIYNIAPSTIHTAIERGWEWDPAPNQLESLETRLENARDFLRDNPDEQPIVAARIYNIPPTTLYTAIKRGWKCGHKGGYNQVLQEHHTLALHKFIRSLLASGILPTHAIVFNAICSLKKAQNPNSKAPSYSWFMKWWKSSNLKKIKSKPLATVRFTAQQEDDVHKWFKTYQSTLSEYGIKKKNIINFDEAGFRVGCTKGQWILVPDDIKEVLLLKKNHRKITTDNLSSITP